ncbi:MAG TPA: hypothetical protein PKM73_12515 [Verrucomicrobiota bacterium]|nr:hypothetical protein [Verrucomicrobiota bacterium]HNU52356.1 hypothetical protein [Verrucomicrobiota bacterium]
MQGSSLKSVLEDLRTCIPILEEFTIERDEEEADGFRNAVLVLANQHLRLRLVLERGLVYADLASPFWPEEWCSIQVVVRYLSETIVPSLAHLAGLDDLAYLIILLDKSYADLVNAFSQAKASATLWGTTRIKRQLAREIASSGDTSNKRLRTPDP